MADVAFRDVDKEFGEGVRAVRGLTLEIPDGEFLVMVGPSGCGKSTALRLVAGLEAPTRGEVRIGGRNVNGLEPQDRNVAMVFQNYALYPHKTVRKNLAFPLKMMKLDKEDIEKRIRRASRLLGLDDVLDRKPRELSGGQRQRVAMGRAIVRDPRVFLMDEPLSNLDAKLRVEIRAEIADLQREIGITTLYVTHDQVEAMTLGERVAVLREGALQQVGPAQELYDRPANTFVASFIGSPRMNIFHSRLKRSGEGYAIECGGRDLPVERGAVESSEALRQRIDEPILVGFRPEAVVEPGAAVGNRRIEAAVTAAEALGHERIVYFESPAELYREIEESRLEESGEEHKRPPSMAARLPAGPQPQPGETLSLAIDTRQLYFFTAEGKALRGKTPA
jgi:multiple sugar transport system ATP-binding protein